MLNSLISGARDVRAPLAVGLTLAAACWFYFGPAFPSPRDASGMPAFIYRTTSALGASASIAAGVFIAYIVGSLCTQIATKTVSIIDRLSISIAMRIYNYPKLPARMHSPLSAYINGWSRISIPRLLNSPFVSFEHEVTKLVKERLANTNRAGLEQLCIEAAREIPEGYGALESVDDFSDAEMRNSLTQVHSNRANREISSLTTRLRIRNSDLYDDYDRVKAESDLRLSLAVPILLLSAALAARWSPWFLALAVVCPILWMHGRELRARADRILGDALVEGVMTTPTLDHLDSVIHRSTPPDSAS